MNAVTERRPSAAQEFRGQFEKMGGEIAHALPPHIPVERFMRVVLTAVNANPALLNADRRTLFEAAMKAAQDGLLPDGRDGAFVMFRTKQGADWIDKVQWMPMIGGILKKVRNSGDLVSISAHVVYENDEFTYILGDDEKIEHRPTLGDRGKMMLAYAIAKTKDGGIYREIMPGSEIARVRNVSRAKDKGPWVEWESEMWRKTVLRRLAKRLPMSSDLDDLIRRDDDLYDLKGGNAEDQAARLFKPVANPLADEAPQIEHEPNADPETGEIMNENDAPANASPVGAREAAAVVASHSAAADLSEDDGAAGDLPEDDGDLPPRTQQRRSREQSSAMSRRIAAGEFD